MDLEEEDENPDDGREDSELDSYACVSALKEDEFESVEHQIEQDVVCAFFSQVGTSRTSRSSKSGLFCGRGRDCKGQPHRTPPSLSYFGGLLP